MIVRASRDIGSFARWRCSAFLTALTLAAGPSASAEHAPLEESVRQRIDAFVESERQASGIPGIALAVVHVSGVQHLRGFGHDGTGATITEHTPFPIGSLSKSFTAVLVRQAIDAGQVEADAPVQRYLPWFRVASADISGRITVRHLLNQTSGFSRAAGMVPVLRHDGASIAELARSAATLDVERAPGERFEYSNLNFIVLGAVLEAVTGRSWHELVHERIFRPLGMSDSHTDHGHARQAGMTELHRMWFGAPVAQQPWFAPGLAPTGGVVASASDMASYLRMLLASGEGAGARVLSAEAVTHLLMPASPPGRSRLLSADFEFRYGEGWFVGPLGVASDARWHLGNLPSFAAWMVLLPETQQAVVLLINANSELPFGDVNAVMSRLPMGVVNLLRGQPPQQGPSLRQAYLPFNVLVVVAVVSVGVLAGLAVRAPRSRWAWSLLGLAGATGLALQAWGLTPTLLAAFAPDLALALAVIGALLATPIALRAAGSWRHERQQGGDR
jgi:CubicO group peptidase (beta-lactamase class C family)